MEILVTGGAGFIGSHLVEMLLERGHGVRVLDDLSTGKRENLDGAERARFSEGDVRDQEAVMKAADGADAVVHLAAVASVQKSVEAPVETAAVNALGTLSVLEGARRCGVKRIVFASSAAVYGNPDTVPVGEGLLPDPLSPYAADKLAGEHYLNSYRVVHGMQGIAVRFFNVYGPRQDPKSPYSGVISLFASAARGGRGVSVHGDGQQTRDFIYVGDLAWVLTELVSTDRELPHTMNIGTGRQTSLLDLLDTMESVAGASIPRTHGAPREGDVRHSRADVGRLDSLFPGRPTTGLEDGLRALLGHA
jgi:UDP-glucose 4-epimerase